MWPKISDLKAKRAALADELSGLYDKAKKDNRSVLNADEQKRFNEITTECEGLEAEMERVLRAQKIVAETEGLADGGNAEGDAPDADDEDDKKKKSKRGVSIQGVRDLGADKPFKSFGEQLRSVANAARQAALLMSAFLS